MKKTIVVVGAGPGLGNAIAREFAAHGFRAALVARSEAHLAAYAEAFRREGIEVDTEAADAARPETLTRALSALTERLGTPDVLVYNVGITAPDGDRAITSELLMERYQIDAASAWHCARLTATEDFAAKRGAILFTGGGFAQTFRPVPGLVPLCIDKAALRAMACILHQQLAPRGIFAGTVLIRGVIAPGDARYDPAVIARVYWDMYEKRQDREVLY